MLKLQDLILTLKDEFKGPLMITKESNYLLMRYTEFYFLLSPTSWFISTICLYFFYLFYSSTQFMDWLIDWLIGGMGFELRSSCLLGRCSTTWLTPPALLGSWHYINLFTCQKYHKKKMAKSFVNGTLRKFWDWIIFIKNK
jgi:hypothetical protein